MGGDHAGSAVLSGDGPVALGPLEVHVAGVGRHRRRTVAWSVANRGDGPVRIRGVRLVFDVERRARARPAAHVPPRIPVVVAVGRGHVRRRRRSLARRRRSPAGARQPPRRRASWPGRRELRSEWSRCSPTSRPIGRPRRLRRRVAPRRHAAAAAVPTETGSRPVELAAEAFLGGARLDPGVERDLHPVSGRRRR